MNKKKVAKQKTFMCTIITSHRIATTFEACILWQTVSKERNRLHPLDGRRKKSYALTCNITLSIAWWARSSLCSLFTCTGNFPHEKAYNITWLHVICTYYEQLGWIRKRLTRKHFHWDVNIGITYVFGTSCCILAVSVSWRRRKSVFCALYICWCCALMWRLSNLFKNILWTLQSFSSHSLLITAI